MITQKTVFETPGGKQFETKEAAEEYMLREDIKSAMCEGEYRDGFDADEGLAALLRDFDITRKEKDDDQRPND